MDELEPGLIRILAPNPSPMTERGTNTYVLGADTVVVIDPGPGSDPHLEAILLAVADRPVSHILVTHSHVDHSTLAPALAAQTGAPIFAFGDSLAGRSAAMTALAKTSEIAGGEGVDHGFAPDHLLKDSEQVGCDLGPLTALHTPGHFGNHMSFLWQGVIFTGDLAMGWASSLISPPDGDVADFLASCGRLADLNPRRLFPGHGAPVEAATDRLRELIAHRQDREVQVLSALQKGPGTVQELTARVYHDVDPALLPAAARNLLAHLVKLHAEDRISASPSLSLTAQFELA